MAGDATQRPGQQAALNEFLVEMSAPVSTDETCVTGHVLSGAFFSGGSVAVVTPRGIPLLAPIVRLGVQDAPVNVVRPGPLATMILRVEAEYIAPGARLTSSDTDAALQETMVVMGGGGQAAAAVATEADDTVLRQAERLIAERSFVAAKEMLDDFLIGAPESGEAHRLLARLHMEANYELQDNKLALEHGRKAYEAGGHDDAAVLETLALALGLSGQSDYGLRYLERLYKHAASPEERAARAERVLAYRRRFRLPDSWEFFDDQGTVVFESADPAQILTAIRKKSISAEALCRRNRVGKIASLEQSLAPAFPEIAAELEHGNRLFDPGFLILVSVLLLVLLVEIIWVIMT